MHTILKSAALAGVVTLLSVSTSLAKLNCDAPAKDLQGAIDDAVTGEEIVIMGNCDDGPFVISRDLRLIGFRFTELSTSAAGHQVLVITEGASVTLKNFDIDATGNIVGIHIVHGSSVVIGDVDISGASEPAVNIDEASYAQVNNSDLSFNGVGVQFFGSSSGALNGNTITNNVNGVHVGQFSTVSLDGNEISDNTEVGVYVSVGGSYGFANTRGAPNVALSD